MKQLAWHVARGTVARVQVTGTVLMNSAWISVFDKREDVSEVIVPTEIPVAVDLAEIKERLLVSYKKETGEDPCVILTVYRYPAGLSFEGRTPIGVGLAACMDIDEASFRSGTLETLG